MKNNKFKPLYILVSILTSSILHGEPTVQERASTIGNTANSKFNSKSKIRSNALSPIQGNGSVSTIDNSSTFNAAITCFDKAVGLNASISFPSASSMTLSITQDSDMDKSRNHSLTVSSIVGVCQNGLVTGSWGSPIYKAFNISNGKIGTVDSTKNQMNGCFCINNSCGYGGYDSNIHSSISGGINSVLVANNVNIAGVSDYSEITNGFKIEYNYPSTCQGGTIPNQYGGSDPRNYYAGQVQPNIDSAVASTDGKNSLSLYSSVKKHSSTTIPITGNAVTVNYKAISECTIINKPSLSNGNIIFTEVNSCSNVPSTCTKRSEHLCNELGNNCEQIYFSGTTSSQTKTFCYNSYLADTYEVCDNSSGISAKNNTTQAVSSFTGKHLYRKLTYNCGTESATQDLTQMNNLETDGKGAFKYRDGTAATINGLPTNTASCNAKFCTVKKSVIDTAVHSDSTYDSTTTNEMNVKVCVTSISGASSCPLENGETLIDDCRCEVPSTMSSKAIGEMSAIEEMGRDFSCASN